MDKCYLCEAMIMPFSTAPIVELENGDLMEICEGCANTEFPGWDEEE